MSDDKKMPTKRAPRKRAKSNVAKPTRAATQSVAKGTPAAAPADQVVARAPGSTASGEQNHTPAQRLAVIPMPVRWHDLDAFNHVNNASFLILLEEARLQWLRTVPGAWFGEHAMPVAASIQLHYRRPITWPADSIDVELTCERLGNTSVTIGNRVIERGDASCVYAEGNLVMVWIDPATGKSVPLPEAIRKACAA